MGPFLPHSRSEDLVFGAVHTATDPSCFTLVAPLAIHHDPFEQRSFRSRIAQDTIGFYTLGETLALLILSFGSGPVLDPADATVRLGCRLMELSRARDADLEEYVGAVLMQQAARRLEVLYSNLEAIPGIESWRLDCEELLEIGRSRILDAHYTAPLDLVNLFGQVEAKLKFRRALSDFGHLLTCWPSLYNTARNVFGTHVRKPSVSKIFT